MVLHKMHLNFASAMVAIADSSETVMVFRNQEIDGDFVGGVGVVFDAGLDDGMVVVDVVVWVVDFQLLNTCKTKRTQFTFIMEVIMKNKTRPWKGKECISCIYRCE